jgi:hypothetical protein
MDILIVLTGRKRSGKDTFADFAIAKANCLAKTALADWFKEDLAKEFNLPLEKFYTDDKDKPLDTPIIITRAKLDRLMVLLSERDVKQGYFPHTFTTSRWEGRKIDSIRDLLIWFGSEVVRNNLGGEFHCEVTNQRIKDMKRNLTGNNVIFVTDARFLEQSKFFLDRYPYSYPVLIKRPGGSNSNDPTETANDNFPPGYFFDTIINDGTVKDFEDKAKIALKRISEDVKRKRAQ